MGRQTCNLLCSFKRIQTEGTVFYRSKQYKLPDTDSKRFDMYNFRNSQY